MALAGVFGALAVQGKPASSIVDQRFVVLGAGSAGMGVVGMIARGEGGAAEGAEEEGSRGGGRGGQAEEGAAEEGKPRRGQLMMAAQKVSPGGQEGTRDGPGNK